MLRSLGARPGHFRDANYLWTHLALWPILEIMAATQAENQIPAGWYNDPQHPDIQRYWDGSNWLDPAHQQSQHRSILSYLTYRLSWQAAGIVLFGLSAFILLLYIMTRVGIGPLAVGFIAAAVLIPVHAVIIWSLDGTEKESRKILLWTAAWGFSAACFIAFILNTLFDIATSPVFGQSSQILGAVVSAPLVEETAKALPIFLIAFLWRKEFDGLIDGIVFAFAVAAGFAVMEDVLYFSSAAHESGVALLGTFIGRGLATPLAHPLFTSFTGIGIALALSGKSKKWLVCAPIGLATAMAMHSLFNLSATIPFGGLLFVFIDIPTFFAMVGFIIYARHRQRKALTHVAQSELATGLIHSDEIGWIMSRPVRRKMLKLAAKTDPQLGGAIDAFSKATIRYARHRVRIGTNYESSRYQPGAEAHTAREEMIAIRPYLDAGHQWFDQFWNQFRMQSVFIGAPSLTPGWYSDPWHYARLRWWNGRAWESHIAN